MPESNTCYEELLSFISDLPVIDTHEHISLFKSQAPNADDFLTVYLAYPQKDMRSAGMSVETLTKLKDPSIPVMERWKLCEPFWEACRNTGFLRMSDRAVREIYGIPGINRDTIEELSRVFRGKGDGERFRETMEKWRIRCAVVDSDPDCDRRYARFAFRLESFVERIEIPEISAQMRRPFHSFPEWLEALDETIDKAVEKGAVAFKTTISTDRSLDIGPGSYAEAKLSFEKAVSDPYERKEPAKAYQDFMFRHVLDRITPLGLPVQMHTGMAASNANLIANGNPVSLCPLLCDYRETRFILMHMAFPYAHELTAMGKMFPNVFLDMSWAHILSPKGARDALDNWLDAMPVNKIMAFGSDHSHEDAIIASLLIARENVARVLSDKVAEGAFSMDYARWAAHQLMFDNAFRGFRLEKAGVPRDA